MALGDDDFGAQYEVNSHRAHLFAYVLIAGLIIELGAGVFWYRGIETIVGTAATLLIVIGVWGEIFFGQKARIAGDKQLAQFEARAAEANQRAQEAALELARLTTPRTISTEQKQRLIEAVQPFAGTPFVLLLQPEPEPLALMEEICGALVDAGWTWLSWPSPIAFVRPGKPSVGMITGTGVRVQLASSKKPEWEGPVLALANALAAVGLEDVLAHESDDGSVADTAVHIRIGRKP
jgi:hypothetical protein